MGLKKLKPNTPGQRHKVADTFDDVTRNFLIEESKVILTF